MLKGSGKPRPFKSPRIVVSTEAVSHGAKKEWQDVHFTLVEKGDIIQGEGLVVDGTVNEMLLDGDKTPIVYVVLQMKNGKELRYQGEETTVRVFTRVRG
jgi:hypothetical protein